MNPRYSGPKPFTKDQFIVNPRFSPPNPFSPSDFNVKPRYSGTLTFNIWVRQLWESLFPHRYISSYLGPITVKLPDYRKSSMEIANYMGPYKMKPVKSKNPHPSYKYKQSIFISSDLMRESLRKWNIFWVRLNRNKEEPAGVRKKVTKPKFDRKEREIWNN